VFTNENQIPARYTCYGANISPPLHWRHVPAHTAELFLLALPLHEPTAAVKGSAVLWSVAAIPPRDRELAAGALPRGAVLGANSAGKQAWGPVCGAEKGQTHHIAFLLYALRRKLHLQPGFNPLLAREHFKKTIIATGLVFATYTAP
jgi:phosphatidylethanolamine-binding protein (PEBP) family uncharacterized protein